MPSALIIAYTHFATDGRVRRQAEALAASGWHVDVICVAGQNDDQAQPNVAVHTVRMARYQGKSRASYARSYARFFFGATALAARLYSRRRHELAVVCTMPDLAVVTALVPRIRGAKVLLDVHDTMPELYEDKFAGRLARFGSSLLRLEERLSALLADRVLAVHEPHRHRLMEAGVPARKIRVLLNLPQRNVFDRTKALSKRPALLEPLTKKFLVSWHGTMSKRLGVDIALPAFAIARKQCPDLHLLLIGSGDQASEVRGLICQLGLEESVTMTERWLPLAELPAVLARASLGLVPNRDTRATRLMLPEKLLEYAMLGIPVVAARLPTIQYYFRDSIAYFSPDKSDELAEAIVRLRRDELLRREYQARAADVLQQLETEQKARPYMSVVNEMVNSRRCETLGTAA